MSISSLPAFIGLNEGSSYTQPIFGTSTPAQPLENFATLKLRISYCLPFRASLFGPLKPFTSITKSIELVTLVVYANFFVLPKPIGKSAKLGVTVSPSPIIPAFGL